MSFEKIISLLKDNPVNQEIHNIVSFESSRNEMLSRVDFILDSYIDEIKQDGRILQMVKEAVKGFYKKTELEQYCPVRSEVFFKVEFLDYLLIQTILYFDTDGNPIENLSLDNLNQYTEELTFNHKMKIRIGSITIYGKSINEYDKGFLKSFREKLDTAILGFNRRKFYFENDLIINKLNTIIGEEQSIETKRNRILSEITNGVQAEEGYFILIRDGILPSIDSISVEDLEISEIFTLEKRRVSEDKQSYILQKALFAIKSTRLIDCFDDKKDAYGFTLAAEIKVNKTRVGGSIVLFDDKEFSSARQKLVESAITKIDDYIILNNDMKKEKEIRERMEHVLIPMVGKEQASYLLEKQNFQKFTDPMGRFVIVMISDMKGSTNAADLLMRERKKYKNDDPYLLNQYQKYIDTINSYLGLVTEAVLSFEGVVDKYIGDAVMAEWGVPIENPDQKDIARRAILAAVFSNILTIKHNQKLEKMGSDPIYILQQRFVLHCGEALAGVYGTNLRYNYTVMGATVNETARIEGLPVSEVGKVTMSHEFYSLIDDVVEAEFIGEFNLKGKIDPIRIYHFKGFKLNDFSAFAKQYTNKNRETIFNQNTFFNDFINGKYNVVSYLKMW